MTVNIKRIASMSAFIFTYTLLAPTSFAQTLGPTLFDSDPGYRKSLVDGNQQTLDMVELATKKLIHTFGNEKDHELINSLSYNMTQNWHPYQAFARMEGNKPIVEFDIGFIGFLQGFFTAVQLDRYKGTNAANDYLENFYSYVAGDTNQINDHILKHFNSPEEVQQFMSDPQIYEESLNFLIFSLVGVALHEFCHHKLGHTQNLIVELDNQIPTEEEFAAISKKSIAREIAADECGIEYSVKAGVPPSVSYLFANSIGIMQDNISKRNSLSNKLRTHPMSSERLDRAFSRTKEALSNLNKNSHLYGSQTFPESYADDFLKATNDARELLDEIGK